MEYRTKLRGAANYSDWQLVSGVLQVSIPANARTGTWVQMRTVGADGTRSDTVLLLVQVSGVSIEAAERGDVPAACRMPALRSISYLKSGKARVRLAGGTLACLQVRSTATNAKHYTSWRSAKTRSVMSVKLHLGKPGVLQFKAGHKLGKIVLFRPQVLR